MKKNILSELIKNITKHKNTIQVDYEEINKIEKLISDKSYLLFLKAANGGGIFNDSLNFYGVLPNKLNSEIFFNNFLFKKYYSHLIDISLSFGEDIFGNQYVFLRDNRVACINLETAEIDFLFTDFKDFAEELFKDPNYYSGASLVEQWNEKNGKLSEFQRLCPIMPFVLGGQYEISNFHSLEKEKLFDYNSHIANQIKNLPDGVTIQLKFLPSPQK